MSAGLAQDREGRGQGRRSGDETRREGPGGSWELRYIQAPKAVVTAIITLA